jgi:hypothetical protein
VEIEKSFSHIKKEMETQDKEREYINPFERSELIDLYLFYEIKEASAILDNEKLGNFVKGLIAKIDRIRA